MIPKDQKIIYSSYLNGGDVGDNLLKDCKYWIDKGWIIHQIIPKNGGSFWILLYKY